MRILLSGATSFIGHALAGQLLGEGHRVYAVVREGSERKIQYKGLESFYIIRADINRLKEDFWKSLRETEKKREEKEESEAFFDLCIHLAWEGIGAKGRMDLSIQERNIANTLVLLKIAQECGIKRFIFAGSQAEYGVTLEKIAKGRYPQDILLHEELACEPLSEYGRAKLEVLHSVKEYCKRFDLEYLHMRIFSVYGYGDHPTSLISSCIRALQKEERILLGPCIQLWNYMYVQDCVEAIAKLAVSVFPEKERCGIVNIASEDTRPLYEFVNEIERIYHKKAYIGFEERISGPEGTPFLNPSTEKLKRMTGFQAKISFEKGIQNIEKMYRM